MPKYKRDWDPMSIWKNLGLAVALAMGGQLAAAVVPAAAASLPALMSVADDARGVTEVRYRGGRSYGGYGYGYGGYGYYGGYGFYGPPAIVYAAPPVVYSYRATGSSYCARLRHRARETGSRLLWNRYRNEC